MARHALGETEYAAVTNPVVIPLKTSDAPLYLRSSLQFIYTDDQRFSSERKVSTVHYAHTVAETDAMKPQLYSWEWASVEPRYPHLHSRRSDPAFHGLGKLHIPTGRVFFEDVLRFLIDEHDVIPARSNWSEALEESHRRVTSFASWGGGHHPKEDAPGP